LVQEERGHVNVQDADTDEVYNAVVENLKQVYDPEISVNIYDLGLIYKIEISNNVCKILMSLTSAFCPAADEIIADTHYAAFSVDGITDVEVDITFDPQWGPELMSDDAKLILGIF
jgi:metal-sulfur cluster biosynthetic enzyme